MLRIFIVLSITTYAYSQVVIPDRIGFVTVQKIINNSQIGKSDKQDMKNSIAKAKQELTRLQRDAKYATDAFVAQLSVLNKSAKEAKRKELHEKDLAIIKYNQESQKNITHEHNERVRQLLGYITEITEDLADDNDLDFILSDLKNGVVYAKARLDLTEQVIQILNEEY